MGFRNHRIISAFNGRLAFAVSVLMLSQINFGMDINAFSTTQAMTAFEEKFGVWNEERQRSIIEPYFLSLLNSLTYAGQVVGVITGGYIGRRWGRRMSFFVMCFWAVISAILLVTAQHKEQMLVGRILNYIYIGQELATVPVMQSEIVPANVRGFVVGTYQLGTMFGSFLMSLITYGTSRMSSEASFRIPLGLFFVIPVVVFAGVWFIPESPRWLLVHNRPEEAMVSLRKYRQGRFTEEEIVEEYQTQVAFVRMNHEKGTFQEMWQGTNLKRSLIVIGANISIQISGQSFSSKYGAVFLKDIGAIDPFAMYCISTGLSILVVMFSMYFLDKMGRRPPLIAGSVLQSGSMLAMGGLGTNSTLTDSQAVGITALLTIFYGGFCLGWAPIYHILTAEIPNSRMRDMTYTVASVVTVVTQFAVAFTIPYLYYEPYAALGPKIGLIFGSLAVCTLVFAIFCIPECRKLSLEEVDHLFMNKTPILKFGKHKHGQILPPEVLEITSEKLEDGPNVEQKEVVA
ncbi:uncharacterized protein Z518_07183 [Rhinocladiella mackenziei CBS 650.93]|uniref:Major facilitator superfamily (MFS) profile domain-containing protein n=1 Tax=Rhinocladiella mackenziei CBS 650.93 TaxID=1442369 RepID=A0A0D2J3R6_9EURO|nr:uncharacterized protein Z518_07183 [Rhinocladiella mackenziei CBS 650.93]KIX03630.1 hypothetical protein Z518_07183 [Rhinocladiella mackenziei CBS 650.93]